MLFIIIIDIDFAYLFKYQVSKFYINDLIFVDVFLDNFAQHFLVDL